MSREVSTGADLMRPEVADGCGRTEGAMEDGTTGGKRICGGKLSPEGDSPTDHKPMEVVEVAVLKKLWGNARRWTLIDRQL